MELRKSDRVFGNLGGTADMQQFVLCKTMGCIFLFSQSRSGGIAGGCRLNRQKNLGTEIVPGGHFYVCNYWI